MSTAPAVIPEQETVATSAKFRCANEICFNAEPVHLLCLAWPKEWTKLGVIPEFLVYHLPSSHPLAPTINEETCFAPSLCEWVRLDTLMETPVDFIETLKQSALRVTLRAARDLLPFVRDGLRDEQRVDDPYAVDHPYAAENLRLLINGDREFCCPQKRK